jgi:crotonobetaine/carnitine-CoA ligase
MPSLTSYWEVAKETGATATILVSSMVPVLLAAPPSPRDRDHCVRLVMASPLPADAEAFRERFGVRDVITGLGCTETCVSICTRPGHPIVPGSLGRRRPGWEIRVVDEHDIEVPVGSVGELIVRPREPWCWSSGYLGDEAATALAWRNGWFHTGDLIRQDEDGNCFFVDRGKDAVRRRGENISSYEVEMEVAAHPQVEEVACVSVPRMPHYMLPRYYEVVSELPKSPTFKVQKFVLRDWGNSDATWDLEVDGGHRSTSRGLVSVEPAAR